MKTISVAKHFSINPAGRFVTDGPYSGEKFREVLSASLDLHDVTVDLDGTIGYGSSFLEEAFGGLVRKCGFTPESLHKKMKIESKQDPSLVEEVWEYIDGPNPSEKNSMWSESTRESVVYQISTRMVKKLEKCYDDAEEKPSLYRTVMSTFFQILWIPGGVGLLGVMLAFEKGEPWTLRLLGGAVALLMLPFMLLTVIGLFVSEGIDKIKELKTK